MSTLHKIVFSLLLTVVLFSIFIFVGFSGLFSTFETKFYNKKIEQIYIDKTKKIADDINTYNTTNKKRFQSILNDIDIQKIYTSQWDEQYIVKLHNLFGLLLDQYPGIEFVWFYDKKGLIHYSTADFAVKSVSGRYKKVFKNLKEAVKNSKTASSDTTVIDINLLQSNNEAPFIFTLDDKHGLFLYKYKAVDSLKLTRGTVVFVVNKSDLKRYLVQKNDIQINDRLVFYNGSYLINGTTSAMADQNIDTERKIKRVISGNNDLFIDPSTKEEYLLFGSTSNYGSVINFVNAREFKLGNGVKVLVLVILFVTLYLLFFLFFNMRQNKLSLLQGKIKKFQISFIKEYLDSQYNEQHTDLGVDLRRKSKEIKQEIKKGIGKIKRNQQEKIDKMINDSWNELLNLIETRIQENRQTTSAHVEIGNLEEIIAKVLSSENKLLPVSPRGSVPEAPAAGAEEPEELAELEEVSGEEPEELAELEEVPEAGAAGAEEPEELAELEEVPEAGAAVTEEPEELAELEEVPEAAAAADLAGFDFSSDIKQTAIVDLEQEVSERFPLGIEKSADESSAKILSFKHEVKTEKDAVDTGIEELEQFQVDTRIYDLEKVSGGENFVMSPYRQFIFESPVQGYLEKVNEDELKVREDVAMINSKKTGVDDGKPAEHTDQEIEELEELEELDELEELEELEELDGDTKQVSLEITGASLHDKINKCAQMDICELISYSEYYSTLANVDSVILSNGVYKIKEEVYKKESSKKDQNLEELVNAVITENDTMSDSSIGNFLGLSSVELPMISGKDNNPKAAGGMKTRTGKVTVFLTEKGFNLDQYIERYGSTRLGIMKSIMSLSRHMNAIYAGVLLKQGTMWVLSDTLGFKPETISNFKIPEGTSFGQEIFSERYIFLSKRGKTGIRELDSLFEAEDAKHMGGVFMFPALFRGSEAYLLFVVKTADRTLQQYAQKLNSV